MFKSDSFSFFNDEAIMFWTLRSTGFFRRLPLKKDFFFFFDRLCSLFYTTFLSLQISYKFLSSFLKPKVYNAAITGITRGIITTHFSHEFGEIEKDTTSIALALWFFNFFFCDSESSYLKRNWHMTLQSQVVLIGQINFFFCIFRCIHLN